MGDARSQLVMSRIIINGSRALHSGDSREQGLTLLAGGRGPYEGVVVVAVSVMRVIWTRYPNIANLTASSGHDSFAVHWTVHVPVIWTALLAGSSLGNGDRTIVRSTGV